MLVVFGIWINLFISLAVFFFQNDITMFFDILQFLFKQAKATT